jgi:hypothetical protein
MLPAMNLAAIGHLADKAAVFQQMRERTHAETAPPIVRPPASRRSLLIPRRSSSSARARTEPWRGEEQVNEGQASLRAFSLWSRETPSTATLIAR